MNDGIPYILFFIPTEQNRYITPFIINKLLHNGRTHPHHTLVIILGGISYHACLDESVPIICTGSTYPEKRL